MRGYSFSHISCTENHLCRWVPKSNIHKVAFDPYFFLHAIVCVCVLICHPRLRECATPEIISSRKKIQRSTKLIKWNQRPLKKTETDIWLPWLEAESSQRIRVQQWVRERTNRNSHCSYSPHFSIKFSQTTYWLFWAMLKKNKHQQPEHCCGLRF